MLFRSILVFDLFNNAWATVDEGILACGVAAWQKLRIQGQERLCHVGVDGALHLIDSGDQDETPWHQVGLGANPWPQSIRKIAVNTRVVTRGYLAGDWDRKRWKSVKLRTASNNATLAVSAVTEGAFEEEALMAVPTWTRGHSMRRDVDDYDPTVDDTNAVSGDAGFHGSPYREDYSVLVNPTGAIVNGGLYPDFMQTHTCGMPFDARGHELQLDIRCSTGRLELAAVQLEAIEDERRTADRS